MRHKYFKSSNQLSTFSRRKFLQTSGAVAGAAALGAPFVSRASAADGITWYATSSARSVQAWANEFQKKSGIPTQVFRSGGVKMAQKFEEEVKANQVRCSVLDTSLPGIMMDWVKKGLIQKYDSPEGKHYPKDAQDPGYWYPIKALVLVMSYNADIIKPADAPKKWEDLLDPKWKGKMVMPDAAYSGAAFHWFAAMHKHFGKSYMDKLSKQDVALRQGNGAAANAVVSGERPLAAMILEYRTFVDIKKGANVQIVIPDEGVPITEMVIGIPKAAPNPEGAKKFIDFALSRDAQQSWQDTYNTPSLRDDVTPLTSVHGRLPLSKVKRLASTPADIYEYQEQQPKLLDMWNKYFK